MITPDLAWRLRERGLLLPVNGQYSTERLREIAVLQDKLTKEMQALDKELFNLDNELFDMSEKVDT